jgi:hypothetical protein
MATETVTSAEEGAVRAAILYRLYDRRGRLLYVGVTGRGMRRMSEHAEVQAWWPMVNRIDVAHFPRWGDARASELTAIRGERPLYNKQDTYHWTRKGVVRAALYFLGVIIPLVAALLSVVLLAVGSTVVTPRIAPTGSGRALITVATLLATTTYLCEAVGILRTPPSVRIRLACWVRCGLSGATCVALLLLVGPTPELDLPYLWALRVLYYVAFGLLIPLQLLHMWTRRKVLYDGGGPNAWTVRAGPAMAPLSGLEAARIIGGEEWRRLSGIIRR